MELAKALQNDPRPGVVHAAGFQLLQQGIMETMRKTGNADAVEGLIFTFIEKNGLDTAIIGLIFQLGEELGDPQGIWEEGNESPGNADEITHPGDPASHPPEDDTRTAVAESSCGKLIRLVDKVL